MDEKTRKVLTQLAEAGANIRGYAEDMLSGDTEVSAAAFRNSIDDAHRSLSDLKTVLSRTD